MCARSLAVTSVADGRPVGGSTDARPGGGATRSHIARRAPAWSTCAGPVLAIGRQDHRLVRVGAEPGARPPDLVHDDVVDVLRSSFARPAASRSHVSAANPTRIRSPLRSPSSREDVGGRLQMQLRDAGFLLELAVGRGLRPEVGDGGGHHDDVGVGGAATGPPAHLLGGADADRRRRRAAAATVPGPRTRRTSAPRASGLRGDRDAHLAGRAVADEAHGIDRFLGRAGGDHDPAPGERAASPTAPAIAWKISSGSAMRPRPSSPWASAPTTGPDEAAPRSTSVATFAAWRRVLPHAGVHRRGEDQRARRARAAST